MRNAIQHVLALLALTIVTSAQSALGQLQDWPWLGVIITDISSGTAGSYADSGAGAYVTGIEQPGPASAAGLYRHDIIIAIDGHAALNTRELTCLIQGKRPGDTVMVTIMRGGQQQHVSATLGRWPESREFPRPAIGNCGKDPISWLPGGLPAA